MSPGVIRTNTLRALRRAIATFGELHPATWAAYGRAIAAWRREQLTRIAPRMPPLSMEFRLTDRNRLVQAANTAMARATGDPTRGNRRHRRFLCEIAARMSRRDISKAQAWGAAL